MMNDEAQIISVTIDSFRFVFDVTKENLEIMQKAAMIFYKAAKGSAKTIGAGAKTGAKKITGIPKWLTFHKVSGRTNRKNFNVKAGAGAMFTLDEKYIKEFSALARKSGVLYVKLGNFDRKSKKVHLLIPAQQSGIVNINMQIILAKELKKFEKEIKKELKAEGFKGKELKEEIENRLKKKENELEKENCIETVNQFADEQGFADMTMEEFNESMKQNNENNFNYPPVRAEDIRKNVEEIKDAIQRKIYGGVVNNHDMIYAEFDLKLVTGMDEKNVVVTDSALENEITVPKECLVRLSGGKCIIVMPKETSVDVKKISDGSIKTMAAGEFKKLMQKGQKGYSSEFRKLFYEGGRKTANRNQNTGKARK